MRRRLWSIFSRMRLAVVLMLALALVMAAGTLLPQMPYGLDAAGEAAWLARAQDRYGALTGVLSVLGLFRVFRSAWFVIPFALLMINTLICTLNRLPGAWRDVAHPRTRLADRLFDRLPQRVTLPAGKLEQVRSVLARRGFAVRLEQTGETTLLYADRFRLARLGTVFLHLGVLLILIAVGVRVLVSWRDDALTLPPDQVQDVGHGLAFALRNDGFTVDRYPDGTARGFRAQVAVLEGGSVIRQVTIRANEPLHHQAVGFYLYSYGDGRQFGAPEGTYYVVLMAVYDPSFAVMVAAGALVLVGLILSLSLPFERLWGRVNPDGRLELAGQAGEAIFGRLKRLAGGGQ